MKILKPKKTLSTEELADILKKGFSDKYSYELFGLGTNQSVIVRKSPFVGVQVSQLGNEITIQGISPSKVSWPLVFIDTLMSGTPLIAGVLFGSSWKKLEKEVALFLNHRFA